MIQVRKSTERGRGSFDWLRSWHSFSFGQYHDPAHMGVSILRVINEDIVAPGGGFPMHGHQDMEIVTYILSGALAHRDSLGNGSVIRPGQVQRMSAGRGVRHSEFNASDTEPVHLLQIWLLPNAPGVAPGYEEGDFPDAERRGRLRLLVSPDGRDGSLRAHQDGLLYATLLADGEAVGHDLAPGRRAYVHVARGNARVNGVALGAGDAATVTDEASLGITGAGDAEVLLFDLP